MISRQELAKITPVSPPTVKRTTNPNTQNKFSLGNRDDPSRDATHLKILIPVGTAITMVAVVK